MAGYGCHSSMCSKYHSWFTEMGYPQLDIAEYPDGEWSIIEYQNSPIIPSLTRFKPVLTGLRNIMITRGFCEKYVKQLDTQRKEFWANEYAKERKLDEEHAAKERHTTETAEKAAEAVTRNPGLMERIWNDGLKEMTLARIMKHIPKWQL